MENKNCGIIYVATGQKYIDEALFSAHSAKSVMPDIGITLYSDKVPLDVDLSCFDNICLLNDPSYSYIDKIKPLLQSPYENTIFLDTDTYLIDSVYEIFELLSKYNLAYAHSPVRVSPWVVDLGIPACFPEANTGVIAFKKCNDINILFESWLGIYKEQLSMVSPPNHDQPSFRLALYQSNILHTVLPPEYNLRTIVPCSKGKAKVKILHGRQPSLGRAILEVNNCDAISIFDFR
ncbi:hypothetical protein SAMN02745119_01944 [Trichlorobacter thiogenes]|uniref:Nucleotide-diphospho-sugar transferase domain-containing protein n=1 Tax=Trichlorobacter thiogenes TaxID=115783 RepID=A0A1T4PDE2_9BACT|nr:hypothetical protein [Trichlorobacter thiogenes]SJZ89381.1 hypothetical protein SAMN02745119_01944 [Trichlorobacter thiogenes]